MRRRHSRALAASLAVVAVAGTSVLATNALYTDRDTVAENVITAGHVDLSSDARTGVLSLEGMVPGGSVTKTVTVTNDGPLALRYALSSAVSGDAGLAGALRLGVTGPASAVLAANKTLAGPVVGDPASGQQDGDRTLAAGASEALTITVSLPKAAGNEIAGQTVTSTLTFDAEQTVHNTTLASTWPGQGPDAPSTLSPAVTTLGGNATNVTDLRQIASDGTNFYIVSTSATAPGLYQVPVATPSATWTRLTDAPVTSITVSKGRLYAGAANSGTLYEIDKTTGATTSRATRPGGQSTYGLTSTGTHLYATDLFAGTVTRYAQAADGTLSAPTTVWTGLGRPQGILVDATGTMYVATDAFVARLMRKDGATGVVTTHDKAGGRSLFSLVGADSAIYASDLHTGSVYRFDTTTRTFTTTVTSAANRPLGLATDGAALYAGSWGGGGLQRIG